METKQKTAATISQQHYPQTTVKRYNDRSQRSNGCSQRSSNRSQKQPQDPSKASKQSTNHEWRRDSRQQNMIKQSKPNKRAKRQWIHHRVRSRWSTAKHCTQPLKNDLPFDIRHNPCAPAIPNRLVQLLNADAQSNNGENVDDRP